ncbi:MAG: succinate dehydrogenase, cytochrome b556 subunit [Candidatus Nanopelagicales bacterium]
MHVLDTALVRVSPNTYDLVIATYKTPIVNLLEVGLVAAVLYHALNGIRIILVDFWSKGARYQKQMLWAVGIIWAVVMLPGAYFMLLHTIESLFGSTS